MPACTSGEDGKRGPGVRSAREIKATLLRQAFDGDSKRSAGEMIRMIQDAHDRASIMPEDHRIVLNLIDRTQPRSIMMLNALAALFGITTRYTETSGRNFIMPESSMMQ